MKPSDQLEVVLLCAGRGSRLGSYTDKVPKCCVRITETKSLVEVMYDRLSELSSRDPLIVTGYQREVLEQKFPRTVHSPRWHSTEILMSFLKGIEMLDLKSASHFLFCYGDILLSQRDLKKLVTTEADICLLSDPNFKSTWESRMRDIQSDLESFKVAGSSRVIDIGNQIQSSDIASLHGQYVGAFCFTSRGLKLFLDHLKFIDEATKLRLQMTKAFNDYITCGGLIHKIDIEDPWFEIDTPSDLKICNKYLEGNQLW